MIFFRSHCVNSVSLSRQRKADFQEIRATKLWNILGVLLICTVLLQGPTSAQLMAPEEVLGFQVGSDYQVAGWKTVSDYMRHVAANSDRVLVEELGKTTEGNALLMLLISTPENLENLARYQQIQRELAIPTKRSVELDALAQEGKAVVLINCNLHSTEIASSQMSMELAHQFATAETPRIKEILENVIILLIPSANPDGLNIVVDWYNRTVGTPHEGSEIPWLYHKYTGHDNNRDWFMLTQIETQLLTRVLYEEWFPEVVYDVHEMSYRGPRFVIPPYFEPVNPNIPPLLQRTLSLIGAQLAFDLTSDGFTGVLSSAVYDTWWHGGFRTVPYRHNMVGILTEAARVEIATPIFQPHHTLKGYRRGLDQYALRTNFPEPWPGGWWRLRNIVDYEKAAAFSILNFVAEHRVTLKTNFYKMGLNAIAKGQDEPPRAFLIPTEQRDIHTALKMLDILKRGGVQIHQANAPFTADGVEYPADTYVVLMSQPFRAHAKDLLEVQRYPERRPSPESPPERPYDIAGWTLPLQMGVRTIAVVHPFEADLAQLPMLPTMEGTLDGTPEPTSYLFENRTNAEALFLNHLFNARFGDDSPKYKLYSARRDVELAGKTLPRGAILIKTVEPPLQQIAELNALASEYGIHIHADASIDEENLGRIFSRVDAPRLGLYKPWTANMDEGWTRWVLDTHGFNYNSLTNAEIRAGNLARRYDAIILPDLGASGILNGHSAGKLPPEYTGGIGTEGLANLRTFVADGGTLICLNRATELPLKYFGLGEKGIVNVVEKNNQPNEDAFFCPGSLLRVRIDTRHPIGYGLDSEMAIFFKSGPVFDGVRGDSEAVATYPEFNPLMSGWLEGEKRIRQKVALLETLLGNGRVILFGFKPQHRGQSYGTFKLLFNAIYYSAISEDM
ncbi:MAG: M14 family metallopeptidase [Candidatus Poribacteria bacterium]|nr:M14 family metallopeptidase [Candidatus Poribacteria bacterium]